MYIFMIFYDMISGYEAKQVVSPKKNSFGMAQMGKELPRRVPVD